MSWQEFKKNILWPNFFFMLTLHALFLYYTIIFPYLECKILLAWVLVTLVLAEFGVTAGVHRLWSHRAYKAKLPLRIILAALYHSAAQNSIVNWVRDHRVHHKYADTPADPHDSSRGLWFSHVGWLVMKENPEIRQRRAEVNMSDVLADPVVRFFEKHHVPLKILLAFVIPIFIPVYFFNQSFKWSLISQLLIRYPLNLNITWTINSFAHKFGYRSYDKNIKSADNIWTNFLTGGEGIHNFHHVFPWDYKASEWKSLFSNTTTWIDMFAKIGWAYDLKRVSPEYIKLVVERRGDGTHQFYDK
ncbi:acyl-CoA Delta(11) desaturase-like [Cotesia glomerata]|uniref:Fatty acid desaturase domain-containing protein n=1 Tax=Cotesia glomerata TaxID=32391 RepID=A0AAV7J7H1_COTGL|nr:acyl-CoA Delta(11) desaturase-like [Cotesia glomerata]KAH0567426.1 hypothetical protein KQX54_009887 [Cotesia glomerata]